MSNGTTKDSRAIIQYADYDTRQVIAQHARFPYQAIPIEGQLVYGPTGWLKVKQTYLQQSEDVLILVVPA